eukprot:gb/GECH01009939.1/.p1 GENE.gb/GECH01009939.1/~~gb/GECH01009939.1/.p1  ORF type:complete len:376 (+),score=125.17 gb/GECH01009939.1/:1-1128(+)
MSSLFKQKVGSKRPRSSIDDKDEPQAKRSKIMDKPNEKIIDILKDLAITERNAGEQFKAKAYRKAIDTISKLDYPINSGKEAQKLSGIGAKIAKKIDEILESGTLKKRDTALSDSKTIAINELCQVSGIGPSFAKRIYTENSIDSINSLQEAVQNSKIKLNRHQSVGLKYFTEFEKRVPRGEISKLENIVKFVANSIDSSLHIDVCGSYRRGRSESGDIDILLTHPHTSSKCSEDYHFLSKLISRLEKLKIITDTMSLGKTKFTGVCILPDSDQKYQPHLHRRMDIRFICFDSYFTALLYYTGSDHFNNQMRTKANENGFTLNEYQLVRFKDQKGKLKKGTKAEEKDKIVIPVQSEREIFDAIGMPYVEPKERDY